MKSKSVIMIGLFLLLPFTATAQQQIEKTFDALRQSKAQKEVWSEHTIEKDPETGKLEGLSDIYDFLITDPQNKNLVNAIEQAFHQDEGKAYNREHAMPKSWFNEGSNATDYPMYTDLHHLFPTDYIVNEMRSNYPYGEVDKSMKPTKQSEGGFSKFGICDPSIGYTVVNGKPRVFEPNDEYKGDLARVYFYMATCYEAYKTNAGKERSPLDWDKSDKTMLDGTIYPFFKEWAIKMLLRWAIEDPVSEKEINRNAAIFGRQKNRNPFVDYPGLEQYIWGSSTDVAFSYDNYTMPDMSGGNAQGDVNGDGKIDIADVVALSIAILTGSTDLKYDINNDEKVNSEDIIALVNIIVG